MAYTSQSIEGMGKAASAALSYAVPIYAVVKGLVSSISNPLSAADKSSSEGVAGISKYLAENKQDGMVTSNAPKQVQGEGFGLQAELGEQLLPGLQKLMGGISYQDPGAIANQYYQGNTNVDSSKQQPVYGNSGIAQYLKKDRGY
jgi:hypothetical protein